MLSNEMKENTYVEFSLSNPSNKFTWSPQHACPSSHGRLSLFLYFVILRLEQTTEVKMSVRQVPFNRER